MPIPAKPDGRDATSALLALFRQLHDQLRDELSGLDLDALNWVPTVGANSISTIVTHLAGSEMETLRSVAGLPSERDRDAEYSGGARTLSEVLGQLDEADVVIATALNHIDEERLESTCALPTLPAAEVRSGLTWLVGNYGHAREHLGHVQLTKQLYQAQQSRSS
jgi:Protein of unknown function (DUF1572)